MSKQGVGSAKASVKVVNIGGISGRKYLFLLG